MRPLMTRASRFLRDEGGVAAVEMAFLAPVALALLSLGVAGGQTLSADHKTVLAAHSITDLVSRTPFVADPAVARAGVLNQSDLDADLALSSMILYPNSSSGIQYVMSELQVDTTTNTGIVVWSEPYNNATALAKNTRVALAPAYVASGAKFLLYGQITYTFQPLGGVFSLPTMTLSGTEILTLRYAEQLDLKLGQ